MKVDSFLCQEQQKKLSHHTAQICHTLIHISVLKLALFLFDIICYFILLLGIPMGTYLPTTMPVSILVLHQVGLGSHALYFYSYLHP